MPYKTWVVGEEVLAADFNDYLQEQVVATFGSAAVRAGALTAPNVGQVSLLADTGALEVYYGAAIGWRPPWNTAWGTLGYAQNTSAVIGIVAPADLSLAVTWTALAGRRYETRLHGGIFSSVGGDMCGVLLTDAANVQKQSAFIPSMTDAVATHIEVAATEAGLSGTVTRKARGLLAGGTGTVTWYASVAEPAYIRVADIGPSANPA